MNNKKKERETLVKLPIRNFNGWILYRAAMPISEKKRKTKSNYGLEQYRKRIENFDRKMNHVTDIRSQDGPDHRSKERIAKIKGRKQINNMSRKINHQTFYKQPHVKKKSKSKKNKSANMRNELRTLTGDESPKR